jgi:hypothetical protein
MTLRKHYLKVFWEISMACGAILIAVTVWIQLTGAENITRDGMWAIVLLGSTIVLRGTSLINFHDLDDQFMRWNYLISSLSADLTMIALLVWFTPGGKYFRDKGWAIFIVYIILKTLFYCMNYFDSLRNAREINDRLHRMNKE